MMAKEEDESDDRVLVQTWPFKVWATEKMKCQSCNTCLRVPGLRHCIYGGPFVFVRSVCEAETDG